MTTLARKKKQSDTDRRSSHQVNNRTEEAKAVVHSYQNIVETAMFPLFDLQTPAGCQVNPERGHAYTRSSQPGIHVDIK